MLKESIKDKQIELLQQQVNKLMDKVGNTTINNTQVHNKIGKIDNIQQQSNTKIITIFNKIIMFNSIVL